MQYSKVLRVSPTIAILLFYFRTFRRKNTKAPRLFHAQRHLRVKGILCCAVSSSCTPPENSLGPWNGCAHGMRNEIRSKRVVRARSHETSAVQNSSYCHFQIVKRASDQPECFLNRGAIQNGRRWKLDWLLTQRSYEAIHGSYLSSKALSLDFLPQQRDITTALLPPREDIGGIRVEDTAPLAPALALWTGTTLDPAL
jgi:hypothetical protein